MKKNLYLSLTTKISGLCFFILLIFGVVTALQFRSTNQKLIDHVKESFLSDTISLTNSISAQFYERYGDIRAFSSNKLFHVDGSQIDMIEALNNYSGLYGIYDLILFVDTKGKLIAVNTKDSNGKKIDVSTLYNLDYSREPWFKSAINGEFTEDATKGFSGVYVENPHIDPFASLIYKEKKYGSSFSAQVKDNKGNIIGVMSNRANFKWVEQEFINLYQTILARGHKNIQMTLLNKNGLVLFDYYPLSEAKNIETVHNFKTIGKLNLVESGFEPAVRLINGLSGAVFAKIENGKEAVVSFAPIKTKKFIDSLGWGILIQVPKNNALGAMSNAESNYYLTLLCIMLLAQIVAYAVAKHIGRSFMTVSDRLEQNVAQTFEMGQQLGLASGSVAEASNEHSAAIQESISALSEIGSMVSQTVGSAKESLKSSQEVSTKSEEGREVMKDMVSSMASIQQANQQLQSISRIIQEINTKTAVINDIVFKTQLLSFNASIEAARAGQHGRGFSVVAEEVGNLAQMSGNAAREIQSLLSESQSEVSDTLEMIQERVKKGNEVSEIALKSFNEIAGSIKNIAGQVRSITEASQQQELGIQQITKAMNQMDVNSQKNSAASKQASQSANELVDQSERLSEIMKSIRKLVQGDGKSSILNRLYSKNNKQDSTVDSTSYSTTATTKKMASKLLEKYVHTSEQKENESTKDLEKMDKAS
ncbi:MAG: methyl-accepting chemotaxis protein [Pseudobdellovibrionaceae bacterium]